MTGGSRGVVVTGLGPICAAGAGREALRESIEAGRVPRGTHSPEVAGIRWGTYPIYLPPGLEPPPRAGGVSFDPFEDHELRLTVAALYLAIEDAGVPPQALAPAALVLSYEAPGIDRLLRGIFDDLVRLGEGAGVEAHGTATPDHLEAIYRRHRDAVYHTHSFMHLHLAARSLGVHGPALFLNNACASGLYALEAAADQVRAGRCDLALVAAAEVPLLPTKHLWFREVGVCSASGTLRPFDRDRDGLVLGGGAAAVVLEARETAEARGARVYAEYLGGASSQEGWKVAVPNLTERYYEETLRASLRSAGVEPEEVDLLNPHGAGTRLGDLAEAMGITAVFGPWPSRPRITALKPYFGHTLGASALLETAALLIAMERGRIPATPGFRNADPRLQLRCLSEPEDAAVRTAVKMSSGFAGFNAGAVFRRDPPPGPGSRSGTSSGSP